MSHVFKVDADEVHVTGVLAVHAILLIHEVIAGELQVHQLAVGLQQVSLLDQLLGVHHYLWYCQRNTTTTFTFPLYLPQMLFV